MLDYTKLARFQRFFRPGFLVWLGDHEEIYRMFEEQAFALIDKGRTHFSARTIVEEIRHYTRLHEMGNFKINDHRSPDLARVFVIHHPEHAMFWEYRRDDWPKFLEAIGHMPPPPAQADLFGASA